jgi:hypothetical protein
LGTYCSWFGVKEADVRRDIPCVGENIVAVEVLEEINQSRRSEQNMILPEGIG